MAVLIHRFFNDTWVQIAFFLVAADIVLGVIDGVVHGNFRLGYIADFLRNDVLGKVLPFFLIYGGYVYAKSADIVIPGLDLNYIKDGAGALMLAALTASLLNSLKDLDIPIAKLLPNSIAGNDPNAKIDNSATPPTQ